MRKDLAYKQIINQVKEKIGASPYNLISYYNPDGFFKYKDKYFIFEHSSTGDRKTHLGELLQAYTCSKKFKYELIFILILDNQHPTAPKKESEDKRLNYFLDLIDPDRKFIFKIILQNIEEVDTEIKLLELVNSLLEL